MNISVKNRIYAALTTLIMAGGALVYFFVYPSITDIVSIKRQMEGTRLAIEKKYLSGQYLRRASVDLEKVKESASELVKTFVIKDQEDVFLNNFEKQMTNRGHAIVSLNFEEIKNEKLGLSDVLNLTFSLQGTFPELLKAIEEIRQMDQFVNVDNAEFNVVSPSKDNNSGINPIQTVQMTIKAKVYRIDLSKVQNVFDDQNQVKSTN